MSALLLTFFLVQATATIPTVASMPWTMEDSKLPSSMRDAESNYLKLLTKIVRLYPQDRVVSFLKKKENLPFNVCKEDVSCWNDLRRKLGVDAVLRNELTRLGDKYFLYVQVLKGSGNTTTVAGSFTIPISGDWLSKVEESLVKMLVPARWTGRLVINSDVKGAQVVVDGAQVCTTPCRPITLPVGVHAIRITHELYKDFVKFIDIGYHKEASVTANLTAFPKVRGRLRAKQVKQKKSVVTTVVAGPAKPWYRTKWGMAAIVTGVALVSFGVGYALAPDSVVYPPYDVHVDIR